jgi:hypothetical protein
MMRLLGAMEDIAKRGRQRGLGICVISQRVADVNKSVTDLLETLLLFAVTGVRTRKALLEWIDDHADPQQAKDVIATLSTLPPGECWIWSPGWLHVLQRVQLNRIETFDSHATPAPGKSRTIPRTLADVDMAAIKEAMADTIERAKADDPRELHKRIRQLERQLADRPTAVTERVEVPVVDDVTINRLEGALAGIEIATTGMAEKFAAEIAPLAHLRLPPSVEVMPTGLANVARRFGPRFSPGNLRRARKRLIGFPEPRSRAGPASAGRNRRSWIRSPGSRPSRSPTRRAARSPSRHESAQSRAASRRTAPRSGPQG